MNKLGLFENTFNKLSGDRAFMAFYLNEVALKENRTQEDMIALLNCSLEDYYKLGLCKAPEINEDLNKRIQKIAEYTNTSSLILTNIIKYCTIEQISESNTKNSIFWNNLKKMFTLPDWIIHSQTRIYQAGLSFCIVVLAIFTYTSQKNETKNSQLYATDYFNYTDSIKYTHVQDNTYVFRNNL
ncbi:MAG: hypothetical protein ABIP51_05690 [Bacteroidia bacterium]